MKTNSNTSPLIPIPPAPRRIDWFTKGTVLFGGFMQQFGWAFFTMGMLFSWIFVGNSEWVDVFRWTQGPWETVTGEILECTPTNSMENEKNIFECSFQFSFNGVDRAGVAYYLESDVPERGTKVNVEVATNHPTQFRVEGGRTAPFGKWVAFVLLFPLVGVGFLIPGFRNNIRALQLLSRGQVAQGKMEERTTTGGSVTINNHHYPIYQYRFSFEHQGKKVPLEIKTHLADRVEDDPMERILFNPFKPAISALYDAIPNAPEFDAQGNCIPTSFLKSYLFILPAIGIAEIGIILLLLL